MSAPERIEVDGLAPERILQPESVDEAAAAVRRAGQEGRTVLPCGRGTRMESGYPIARVGTVLLTRALERVIHYEPADLTITVGAGIELGALDRILAEQEQVLPLRGWRSGRGTVGGLLAVAPEGAEALGYGLVRSRLTGLRAVLGDGSIVKGGGRVVKNVAGYPIHRLLCGSFGTLGVIVEASFKLAPRPEVEATVVAGFDDQALAFRAARAVLESGFEPVFVNALADDRGTRLAVGFDGSETRVRDHVKRLPDRYAGLRSSGILTLDGDEQRRLRSALDEPEMLAAGPAPRAGIRMSGLPAEVETAASAARKAAADAGAMVVRTDARPGLGSLFVVIEDAGVDRTSRAAAAVLAAGRARGQATVVSAPAAIRRRIDCWGPPPPDSFLMERIKKALDPGGVLARGRFVGGL